MIIHESIPFCDNYSIEAMKRTNDKRWLIRKNCFYFLKGGGERFRFKKMNQNIIELPRVEEKGEGGGGNRRVKEI